MSLPLVSHSGYFRHVFVFSMFCGDVVIQFGREFHSGRRRIKDRVSFESYCLLLSV